LAFELRDSAVIGPGQRLVECCAFGYDVIAKLEAIRGQGRLMNENSPVFFFSYARELKDPLLDDFFDKLIWQASHLGVGDIKTVGFRDTHSINSGEDWTKKISEAVQTSKNHSGARGRA
jgi:hypothetical protein